ncbi:hypothetical protein [Corynebacterium guangdongense]|uniref:Trypsin n=1 Tax=Corynebacterium guangdongense TaxID=1783348 RepID=A0ABU1ZY61_9CORY|nr:hypothetical protein [Corynebacterium guangdongense]MDR7329874.1 hypothetical protein [Corynebacterium guangdongense]
MPQNLALPRLLALFFATLMLLGITTVPAGAQPNSRARVDQGEELVFVLGGQAYACQATWIDHAAARIWTAGGCGPDGASMRAQVNGDWVELGTVTSLYPGDGLRDFLGYIQLRPGQASLLGSNALEPAATGVVAPGSEACVAAASGRQHCVRVTGSDAELLTLGSLGSVADPIYPGAPVTVDGRLVASLDWLAPLATATVLRPVGRASTSEPSLQLMNLQWDASLSYPAGYGDPVNQGDTLGVTTPAGEDLICTLGYVDKLSGRLYTAGHCGGDGAHLYTVDGNGVSEHYLGTLTTDFDMSAPYVDASFDEDYGYVEVPADRVGLLGENSHSGDAMILPSLLAVGQILYALGQTTGAVMITEVMGTLNNIIMSVDGQMPRPGDSGGPVWTVIDDQRYFVGVISGSNEDTGVNVSWLETAEYVDPAINYTDELIDEWLAQELAAADAASPTPVQVTVGGLVGVADNPSSWRLEATCTVTAIDLENNRVHVNPGCPGGRMVTTEDGVWALQELGPLVDASEPYIQVRPDKAHLLAGGAAAPEPVPAEEPTDDVRAASSSLGSSR